MSFHFLLSVMGSFFLVSLLIALVSGAVYEIEEKVFFVENPLYGFPFAIRTYFPKSSSNESFPLIVFEHCLSGADYCA